VELRSVSRSVSLLKAAELTDRGEGGSWRHHHGGKEQVGLRGTSGNPWVFAMENKMCCKLSLQFFGMDGIIGDFTKNKSSTNWYLINRNGDGGILLGRSFNNWNCVMETTMCGSNILICE
jgi:hypothetical protein